MTQEQNETRTVQQYRHAARRTLKQGRESLSVGRTDETKVIYLALNGMIESTLAGKVGLSQEQQVEHLEASLNTLKDNVEALPDQIDAAKASILAQVEEWESTVLSKATEALETLTEARDFARDRDFTAWQAEKGRSVPQPVAAEDYDEDDYDED